MMRRCYDPNYTGYALYGGRGIEVCKSWHAINNFIADMDSTYSPGLTLDRIDNNKGYCKKNCRWVTLTEQARNKRHIKLYTLNGESKLISEWAKIAGISQSMLYGRLKKGESLESAMQPGDRRKRKRG